MHTLRKLGLLDGSNLYLKEYFILEVCINNKNGYEISLYRSPSQTVDDFDSFIISLVKVVVDISRHSPYFAMMTVDFDTISTNCSVDGTKT